MATKKKATRTKLEIDPQQLIKMIDSGSPQKEIMGKFGIKTSTQLKIAYANALMDTGKVAEIKSGRAPGKKEVSKEISVGKRGSLIVPKDLVSELGFQEGDSFTVKKSKVGITLSKTE
jgi:hypothetical protein